MTSTEAARRRLACCCLTLLTVFAYIGQAAVIPDGDTGSWRRADSDFASYFYQQRTRLLPTPPQTPLSSPMPLVTAQPECRWIPDPGPCHGFFRRYYYNWNSQSCEQFIYSGCDGLVPFRTSQLCEEARCDLLMPKSSPPPSPSSGVTSSSPNSTREHVTHSAMTSLWWPLSPLSMSFSTTAHSQPYSWTPVFRYHPMTHLH